jgi:protein-L-isoaspartate(D-aspartate) O-methyltransferase
MFRSIAADPFTQQRHRMVETQLRARDIKDERLLQAMERVPRHEFVAEKFRNKAYEDHPLPIGEGQTISQPYIVAITLAALTLQPTDRVLEIGTGSGYQTALLAELTRHVYAIERHNVLARHAAGILARIGYSNVTVITGDGTQGLAEYAPFDVIVVSAAAPRIPQALFDQLCESGRMVLPVGPRQGQQLQLVSKREGKALTISLGRCAFVPLIGDQGYISGW